jgi:hypothetical protein
MHDKEASNGFGSTCPNFPVDDYSTATQRHESVAYADPTVHMISDSEAQKAQVRKPFRCPVEHCSFCKSESMCICNWLTLLG